MRLQDADAASPRSDWAPFNCQAAPFYETVATRWLVAMTPGPRRGGSGRRTRGGDVFLGEGHLQSQGEGKAILQSDRTFDPDGIIFLVISGV